MKLIKVNLNATENIEFSVALLAFCEFELYRTHVRRRIQIHKIYLRFSLSVQRVDKVDILKKGSSSELPFYTD